MATKFFMNGLVNSNWSSDTNWSTTSSLGPNNTTKAVNGDAVLLDATSPACVIDAASACTSIVCTGYTNTLTFNASLTCAGTVTLATGMTIAGTSDLINTATSTMTSGGKVLTGGLQLTGTSTFTLSGAWDVTGLVQLGGTTLTTTINSSTLACRGGLTINGTSSDVIGTTVISLTGTGTFLMNNSSGTLRCPLTFNSSASTVTVSGTIRYNTGTITYTSGTVTTTGSTLAILGSTTLNTNTISWNNIQFLTSASVITINSLLTATGTILLGNVGTLTFAGTSGFTTAILTNTAYTVTRTVSFKNAVTYTITGEWTNVGTTAAVRQTINSSSAGNKALITLGTSATQFLGYADPTDIDSSGGQTVRTYKGTITTTTNWSTVTPVGTVGYGFS